MSHIAQGEQFTSAEVAALLALKQKYLVAASTAPAGTKALADYVCDGIADDVQINAAIAAIVANGNAGGTVDLSEGQFNLAADISITNSYITIQGSGIGATTIKSQNNTNITILSITGNGVIHVNVRRMQIDANRANNTFGSGIHINTPWNTYDAEHVFEDLLITNVANNGVEVAVSADTRAMFFSRVHVKGSSGNGFYFPWPSITDSIFEDCIADTVALNGFYIGGANNHFSNCKAFYCGSTAGENMGFQLVGYNNYFVNCEAQDNYQSGFYGNAAYGDPTYRNFGCTFVNCIADSNNQNTNATYGCGFQGIGVKQWQIIGGVSMVRPYPGAWGQRVGILFSGAADQNYVSGIFLWQNTNNYSDTSSGNNIYMPGPGQTDHWNWESTGCLNLKHFGAMGDGKRFFGAAASSGSTNVTCTGAGFTSADVGKRVIVYKEGFYGALTTIASVTNSTTIVLTATAGVNTTSANGYIIWGTDDSTLLQKILTYAATFVNKGSLTDPNQPMGSGQVKVLLPGDGIQSLYLCASQITIPVGVVLECEGHIANFLPSRNTPIMLMQGYTGITKLELENLGGTGILAGTTGAQASIQFGDIKIWHGIGSGLTVQSVITTPSSSGGTLPNATYYYQVTAIDSSGGETAVSGEVTALVTGGTNSGSVSLSWTAFTGASSYRIYRGATTGKENVYFTSGTNSYTDTNASSTSLWPVGPGYGLQMLGYHFDIDRIFIKECTTGIYHNSGDDTAVQTAFVIGCTTPIRFNGSNQMHYSNVFLDTCGGTGSLGGIVIDNGVNDCVIDNVQTFSISTVSVTLSPVVAIGSLSTTVNGYISVKFQGNNEGGNGLTIANAQDVAVDMMLSNFVLAQGQTNPFTTGVVYGTGLTNEIKITGTYSSGITPSSGTQVGTHSYQQGGAISNL